MASDTPAMWTGSSAASKSMIQSHSVSPAVAGIGGEGLASKAIYNALGVGGRWEVCQHSLLQGSSENSSVLMRPPGSLGLLMFLVLT